MEQQIHPKHLPPVLQKYHPYFLDEQCSLLNGLNVKDLTQDQKIIVMVTGESNTGKSSTCNELLRFRIKKHGQTQKKKGLFASGSNQLTSFPTFYSYHENLKNTEDISYKFIEKQKTISNEIPSGTQNVSWKTLQKLEQIHQKQRAIISQKKKEQQILKSKIDQTLSHPNQQLQKSQNSELSNTCTALKSECPFKIKQFQNQSTQINDLSRINDELDREMNKSLLIQGPYKLLNSQNQEILNNYVLICDTVGSNDQVKLLKDENQLENQFNCYIICFDLSRGFNKDCKQKLREIYQTCPIPENVTISLNLANYLRLSSDDSDTQMVVDQGSDIDYQPYNGFDNIDQFLQQFLYRIPDTLVDIFNDQGTWRKILSKAESMKNKIWWKQNQIDYFEQVKRKISDFKILLNKEGDKTKLKSSIKKNKKIPDCLMEAYPFQLIKFSGKSFINGFKKDEIVKTVYERADQIFKGKVKGNVQKSLSKMWEQKKQANISQLNEMIERAQNKLQLTKIPKEKLNRLLEFQESAIIPILQFIRDEFLKGIQQKRYQDKQTWIKLNKWIQQHRSAPKERMVYLLSRTVKAEYQDQLSDILNQNTKQIKQIFQKIPYIIKNSKQIKEEIRKIQNIIKAQDDQTMKRQMRKMLVNNIEDQGGRILKHLCVRELQVHNQMITHIKRQVDNKSLQLNLMNLNIPDILNSILLTLFRFLGPALDIIISVSRIALIAFTGIQAVIFSVPLIIVGVVYFPLRLYYARSTDRQMIKKWNDYLILFKIIENIVLRNSERKPSTRVDSLFKNMQRKKKILEEDKKEIENIQSLIKALQQFRQNFKKECLQFESEVLKC